MHTLRVFSLFLFGSVLSICTKAQSVTHRHEAWMVESVPQRVLYSNGYTLVTGSAVYETSQYSGSGLPVDLTTGEPDLTWPKIYGSVDAVIADGDGGWYVAGYFDYVDTVKIQHLVHIKADKTVDRNWKPNPNNSISAMKLDGSTLYIGGFFTNIAGQARNYIAAFDAVTGSLKDWNPNASNYVHTIEVANNLVYAGGSFLNIGGQARTRLAALDPSTAMATSWAPAVNGVVNSLAIDVSTNTIFIGGGFTSAGGQTRTKLARLVTNTTNGLATGWIAELNAAGSVSDLILKNNILYVAGSFNSVGGSTRYGVAAIDATKNTSNVLSWDVKLNSGATVVDIDVSSNALYIAGYFNSVNGIPRESLIAVNVSNATLISDWNPRDNNSVNAIALSSSSLFMGGYFNGINTRDVNGVVLFENATNTPWPYDIDVKGGSILTMAVKDATLYLGGQFDSFNGENRKNLAAINLNTGEVLPWAPAASGPAASFDNSSITTMEIKDNLLYIGGSFLKITTNGTDVQRANLAALDLTTGEPSSWNPKVGDGNSASQFVNSLDVVDNIVYVGGSFNLIGNETRTNLAAVHATSGQIFTWAPEVSDGQITKIQVSGNTAYVLGSFSKTIGGAERTQGIAALDITTGLATSWNPIFIGRVYDFAIGASSIFVGGDFAVLKVDDYESRNRIASFDLSNGQLTSWESNIKQPGEAIPTVYAMAASPTRLHVGGYFEYLGLENRTNYAEYDICSAFKPTIGITDQIEICPGETATLQGQVGFASYQWSTGATTPSITVSAGGSYRLSVTDNQGCTGQSDPIVVSVKPTPQVSIAQNGSVLIATSSDSYQWYQNNQPVQGATSQTFEISVLEYGVFAVAITANGCHARSSDYIYLVTDSEKEVSSIKIYPNPFKDEVNIQVPPQSVITILDVLGQPVTSTTWYHNEGKINTHDLKSGAYILKVHTGNVTRTYKIVKAY